MDKLLSISRLRLFTGVFLILLPLIAAIVGSTFQEVDAKYYTPWPERLRIVVSMLVFPQLKGGCPPGLYMFGPSIIAGFLLLLFKSRWFFLPAVLAFLWVALLSLALLAFNRMGGF
ncbi:MAG: hypothetical protein FWD79_09880 [Desulfobulbus sp.]|nr:hypothetical protein [Desulfobulbus sp.]